MNEEARRELRSAWRDALRLGVRVLTVREPVPGTYVVAVDPGEGPVMWLGEDRSIAGALRRAVSCPIAQWGTA